MKTRVQKWGNSLALRIPKSIALEAGLEEGSPVDISQHEGRIILTSEMKQKFSIPQLLSGVTEENIHGEVDTGPSAGREEW